jgi:hypothetical protein
MKLKFTLCAILSALLIGSISITAKTDIGIEFVSGYSAIGLSAVNPNYAGGLWVGRSQNDSDTPTTLTFLGFWAEKRHQLDEKAFLSFGIDGNIGTGEISGVEIDSKYAFGPYIGIGYYLLDNIMLTTWTNPIAYSVEELTGSDKVTSIDFFSSKIALNYFFK